jgi:hypothetical protein
MNNLETIQYLAHAEAKTFAPLRLDSEFSIPWMHVTKNQAGSYVVEMRGHVGHDNSGRAPLICEFMQKFVLPQVSREVDARGAYPIELHDSYTYLESRGNSDYKGALTFSKDMSHRHTVLFPDPYQLTSYSGLLDMTDTLEFEKKEDIVLFAGTTTGNKIPLENERVRACLWALDKRPNYQFFITNIAQMTPEALVRQVPSCNSFLRHHIPPGDHMKCKYIFNIQGNTCCWSRLPMVMNSKSLLLNLKHRDGTWYYPILQENREFINVPEIESLPSIVNFVSSNPKLCMQITQNANEFVKNYLQFMHATYYAKCLIEAMAYNK